jgi:hypothetical protein
MKNRLWTLVAILAIVALWGKEYAKPVFAQVRAALTRDIDNPARNAVQVELEGGSITYRVPSGKTLVIEDVSFFTPYPTADGNFGIVTTVKGTSLTHWFSPGGYSGGGWYGGRTTRIYADQLTDVFIQTNGSTAGGECMFSGYLLDAAP